MAKNTIIDGIAASEHLDSSGETLNIEGMDISSLGGPDSILNWEHGSKDRPSQVVGKVTFARKIMKKSDAKNKREKYFWNKAKKPFVYIKAELFDGIGHSGAQDVAAMLKYKNRDKGEHSRLVVGFSIEGGKIEKKGMTVTKSIARDVAITVKPCNKVCDAEVVEKDVPDGFLYKNQEFDCEILKKGDISIKLGGYREQVLSDIQKSLASKQNWDNKSKSRINSNSYKESMDKEKNIKKLSTKPLSLQDEARPEKKYRSLGEVPEKTKLNTKVRYDRNDPSKTSKTPDWDSAFKNEKNNMRKALMAGMMGGTPDSKTGGAALASEDLDTTLQKPFEPKPKKISKKIKKNEDSIKKQLHDLMEVDPRTFHKKINTFRDLNDMNRANIHPYSPEDYLQMKTFMTRDGKSGYAIKNGNELVSVHSSERGRGDHLVSHAVKMGARKLDAYDIGGKLPKLYGKHGFQETGRYGFNPEYADASNKLLHTHKPDFVEMSIPEKFKN